MNQTKHVVAIISTERSSSSGSMTTGIRALKNGERGGGGRGGELLPGMRHMKLVGVCHIDDNDANEV